MLRAGFGEEGNMLKKREGRKTLCKTSSLCNFRQFARVKLFTLEITAFQPSFSTRAQRYQPPARFSPRSANPRECPRDTPKRNSNLQRPLDTA